MGGLASLEHNNITCLYCVVKESSEETNTFMLQGASNAGKTYWSQCLTPFKDTIGGDYAKSRLCFYEMFEQGGDYDTGTQSH